MQSVPTVLIDARNFDQVAPALIEKISAASVLGFDTETHNDNAHAGLKEFSTALRTAFDWRRTVVCGFSIYVDGDDTAYYINLNHADIENRLSWEQARQLLDAKPASASWICHNAAFELIVMLTGLGYQMDNYICTLQMAVSAWGMDEYDHEDYISANFGEIKTLFPDVEQLFQSFDAPEEGKDRLSPKQNELLGKVIGKASTSSFSYNGLTDSIKYGYGLKPLIKKFFGVQMETYEEVLKKAGATHMGEITGEAVANYGADDSYWAVKLFYKIYTYMKQNCPETIPTFFSQENPMVQVYANIAVEGMRVNAKAIEERRVIERANFAAALRRLKGSASALLPFPAEPNEKLFKHDKWYTEGYEKYRERLEDWIKSPDSVDDFTQACQVSSAVSSAWAGKKIVAMNLTHYYQSRLFLYDLCRVPAIVVKGKVQSDAETRGTVKDILNNALIKDEFNSNAIALIDTLSEITGVEQRMKLYLNPYSLLTDPETDRMYPTVSSELNTRRMAARNPNPMQLAKRGESTYVRGFFLPDNDDHVIVAPDWSQIELVIIGEESKDPEFFKAFGQTPYEDLHLGAAADVLSVMIPEVTEEMMKTMHKMDAKDLPLQLLVKPNGEPLDPAKAKKYWRTEVGKGSNFNYWYSGALSTVGDKLGWTSDQMWAATEAYRKRFAVAEAWRTGLIEQAKWDGYVTLPDGHRRTRWEITHEWANISRRMFENFRSDAILKFGEQMMTKIRTRAGNQLVNAKVQGTCATLAKRSILSINKEIKAAGFDAFFKMPIHDELVFSVHKNEVVDFIKMVRPIMTTHPEIINHLKIDCTFAIGRTFEPFEMKKLPTCMIELDEAPDILGFTEGSRLNPEEIQGVVDYLFSEAV